MEAIDLVLKIWDIPEELRTDVEEILKTLPPEHLGLCLAMCGRPSDEIEFNTEPEEWMEKYLPELRFV